MGSSAVGAAFVSDNLLDYSSYVVELVKSELPVLIYAGEFDSQDGAKTQEMWLRNTQIPDSSGLWDSQRLIYWVPDPSDSSSYLNGGLYRTNGIFTLLTVPKAGHFVPANYYQPSYQFFYDYLNKQGLDTHAPDAAQPASAQCKAMNNCNGHGTCGANGLCSCDSGYKFGDCSLVSNELTNQYDKSFTAEGPKWYSFTSKQGAPGTALTIKATDTVPATVYLSYGADSDPGQFEYDMMFKNVTSD